MRNRCEIIDSNLLVSFYIASKIYRKIINAKGWIQVLIKEVNKMDRKKAISYLKRKGKIEEGKESFNKEDEAEIKKVVTEGKIYGDPLVEVDF